MTTSSAVLGRCITEVYLDRLNQRLVSSVNFLTQAITVYLPRDCVAARIRSAAARGGRRRLQALVAHACQGMFSPG